MTLLDEIRWKLTNIDIHPEHKRQLRNLVTRYGESKYEEGAIDSDKVAEVSEDSLNYTEGYEKGRAKGTNDGIQRVVNWIQSHTSIPLDVKQAVKKHFGGD